MSALTTTQKGYGTAHQRRRRQWATVVARGEAVCVRCCRAIFPFQPWDLDHSDDRTETRGPAHRKCNRAAGARRGNKKRARVRKIRSRVW
jgi:hypothetical protein